jgi:hypothetical protein
MSDYVVVVVRTRDAGVHIGELVEITNNKIVILRNARRLWQWWGAFTLHEVALKGVEERSRISAPVARIRLLDAIEVIDTTPDARTNLTRSRNC